MPTLLAASSAMLRDAVHRAGRFLAAPRDGGLHFAMPKRLSRAKCDVHHTGAAAACVRTSPVSNREGSYDARHEAFFEPFVSDPAWASRPDPSIIRVALRRLRAAFRGSGTAKPGAGGIHQ